MNFQAAFQRWAPLAVAWAATAIWPVVAVAQEEAQQPADKSGWVLTYALTFLAIILGLVAVCRPGNRSKEVRIKDE